MTCVAVVGAGLMGRLAALTLHRRGYSVSLFDKGDKQADGSAAKAAGGLLTPLGESLHCPPWLVEMGFAALKLWPEILKGLSKPVFFQRIGSIALAHIEDGGDMLRFRRHLDSRWPQYQAHSLDRQALCELEPSLGQGFAQGLYLPEEGQIDNRQLLEALQFELEQEAVVWYCCTEIGNAEALCEDFDWVVDCRGVGAAAQIEDLRGVRGELFRLLAPEVRLSRPVRLMHPRYSLYIAPKPNDLYIVGATEIESDDDSSMTVRSALELLSAAYSVHPGFAEARILEQVSGCRPAFRNNHPQIRHNGRLIQVNGLYRHGFLIAPVVLEHLVQLFAQLEGRTGGHFPFPQIIQSTLESTS